MSLLFLTKNLANIIENLSLPAQMLGIFVIMVLFWLAFCKLHLSVPKGQVAVFSSTRNNGVLSLKPSGHYLIFPGIRKLTGIIPTSGRTASGECQVLSQEGYQLEIEWSIVFRVDPLLTGFGLQPSITKVLLSDPLKLVKIYTNLCIGKCTERYTLDFLWSENAKLKTQTTQEAIRCLAVYGIIVDEIDLNINNNSKSVLYSALPVSSNDRLGEVGISQLAIPRIGPLNQPKKTTGPIRVIDEMPNENPEVDILQSVQT